jgi:3-phosphoshikimate 1-carboxyvinyltransferase
MHDVLELVSSTRRISGSVQLPASKSISNRLLILEEVTSGIVTGIGYSDAEDTKILQQLLHDKPNLAHAGAGGTTFRFLLAILASTPGYEGVLEGSPRLMERPVAPLVDALHLAGADIEYIDKRGFAPLRIRGKQLHGGKIKVDASLSSQFITALLLIAPRMSAALELIPQGDLISAPYIHMTVSLMQQCGFQVQQTDSSILVQPFLPHHKIRILVERDWSAASYWYACVALSEKASIQLPGLTIQSLQGDSACQEQFKQLGVLGVETADGIELRKIPLERFELTIDCISTPDLFQTYAVTLAGLGRDASFKGLQSLPHKETNRMEAVSNELAKIGVKCSYESDGTFKLDASHMDPNRILITETYEDHRMAMAFSPLVLVLKKLAIRNPDVVRKSYPGFWADIRRIGISFAEWKG